MPPGSQIDEKTSVEIRKEHIHNKYKNKLYCDIDPLSNDKEYLNEVTVNALVKFEFFAENIDPFLQRKQHIQVALGSLVCCMKET